jgi:ribosome-associated protein
MIILEDTRQQADKHKSKHIYFEKQGIEVRRCKLYAGDYTLPTNQSICIDTKKDIQELIGDICGKSHERFRNELIRAQESGIKLIILTEDNGGYCDKKKTIYNKPVTCVKDLFSWKNPRLFIFQGGKQKYPKATKGQTLAKCLITLQEKYGCEFLFTTKENSGAEIVRLLAENNN